MDDSKVVFEVAMRMGLRARAWLLGGSACGLVAGPAGLKRVLLAQ